MTLSVCYQIQVMTKEGCGKLEHSLEFRVLQVSSFARGKSHSLEEIRPLGGGGDA
jgi:hypothetical protein